MVLISYECWTAYLEHKDIREYERERSRDRLWLRNRLEDTQGDGNGECILERSVSGWNDGGRHVFLFFILKSMQNDQSSAVAKQIIKYEAQIYSKGLSEMDARPKRMNITNGSKSLQHCQWHCEVLGCWSISFSGTKHVGALLSDDTLSLQCSHVPVFIFCVLFFDLTPSLFQEHTNPAAVWLLSYIYEWVG